MRFAALVLFASVAVLALVPGEIRSATRWSAPLSTSPPPQAVTQPPGAPNLVKVAFDDLGGGGFNADIWSLGDYVYVGRYGASGGHACDGTGVRVIDVSDPLSPAVVDVLSSPIGARVSDVKVAAVNTPFFQGDLLVNSNEACGAGAPNGVQLWNVTDPSNAVEFARFDTRGVHNLYLYAKGDRAYILLAVPFAEVFGANAGLPASDLQIVDVTDPANPFLAGEWTIGRDAGLAFGAPGISGAGLPPGSDCTPPPNTPDLCRGNSPSVYLHDVWANQAGTVAYLSYWDAGLVTLDISDPTSPTLLGVAIEPLSDEGNAHNAVVDEARDLVLLTDEDFSSGPWGFLRIYDASDLTDPFQIASFATDNALAVPPPDFFGIYTIHNVTLVGATAYAGWYSDGVRVIDLSDPLAPKEVASFVPPDVADPHGYFPPKALVWGTAVKDGIVYASDINGGLYVLGFDTDLDGCADIQEQSADPARGGLRDPADFWDFFDTPEDTGVRDRVVSVGDILRAVQRFGATGDPGGDPLLLPPPVPAYHTAFDRGGVDGPNLWDLLPPDGAISVGDIFALVAQFGHSCA